MFGLVTPSPAQAQSQLVTNGDFSAGFTGWSTSGSAGVISGVVYFSGGGAPANGILWQDINTVSGQPYTLNYTVSHIGTLVYGGIPQLLVEARDVTTNAVINSQVSIGSGLTTYSLNFTAQGATHIRFLDRTTNPYDLDVSLDNVSVMAPNTAPMAVNDTYSVELSALLSIPAPGLLANDSDADGDPLTAILVNSDGFISVSPDGALNSYVYDWDAGIYDFAYRAYDGVNYSNVATIRIYVGNQAPVAVDDSYSTDQDVPLTIDASGGVLANDTDVVSPGLTAVNAGDPANGTVTLNTDGSFTYTPDPGYSGPDSFTYTANDGALDSNIVTVTITVNPAANLAPVAVDDSYTTDVNTPLDIPALGVLSNDSDADNDALTAVKVSETAHGVVILNTDGGFTYLPVDSYVGADSFTYKANDGLADSNVATVSITMKYAFTGFFSPVDNLPVINQVKAGQGIPVKFSLGGDLGLSIFAAGYPKSQQVACEAGAPVDAIEETTTSNSGLTYDPLTGLYTFVWKTPRSWANTCRQFTLRLTDGLDHIILFKFK